MGGHWSIAASRNRGCRNKGRVAVILLLLLLLLYDHQLRPFMQSTATSD
jgi:hypothetical protein